MDVSERRLQIRVVRMLDQMGVLFSATMGGVCCSPSERIKMVQSGYRAGIPDLLIFEPRGDYHGLMLELKTEKGRLSPKQRDWITMLGERGYYARVAYGWLEAKYYIQFYLDLKKNTAAASSGSIEESSPKSESSVTEATAGSLPSTVATGAAAEVAGDSIE